MSFSVSRNRSPTAVMKRLSSAKYACSRTMICRSFWLSTSSKSASKYLDRNEFFRFQKPVPDCRYEALIVSEVRVLKDDDLQVLLALNLIKKRIKVFRSE